MVLLSLLLLAPSMVTGAQTATLVWSDNESGHEQIYFSRYADGTWEKPTRLTTSENLDYFPSSFMATDGTVWVVWSSLQGKKILLMYSVLTDNNWSVPATIDTGMSTNTGVSLVLDADDIPWIAWAGFDGSDDEIFWSRWEGSGWRQAELVASANDVPDILPKLAVDGDGVISVYWQSYDGSSYVTKSRSRTDGAWQEGSVQTMQRMGASSTQSDHRVYPQLPAFVADPAKAKMHVPPAK